MRSRVRLTGLSLLLLIILAACGAGEQASLALTPISVTLNPPRELAFVPGCTTKALNDWLENTGFLITAFTETMNQGAQEPPGAQLPIIMRLVQLRDNGLAAVPAPDECAAEAHTIIGNAMDEAIIAFQAYANGDSSDLSPAIQRASNILTDAQTLHALLQNRLEEQIRATENSN